MDSLVHAATMSIKTILNRCHAIRYFVYGSARFVGNQMLVDIRPRNGSQGCCSSCGERGPTYDTAQTARLFEFVPLWGFAVFLVYHMRRIACATCGVRTEQVPWAEGKNRCCDVYRLFLARWARRLSWTEVAQIYGTTWGVVYRAVHWVVDYGLAHRSLDAVKAIGVDEIAVWAGHKYLTVVYQIDQGARRLLWVGKDRTKATIRGFFTMFGEARAKALQFVVSDMWKPYMDVIKEKAGQALHILDRFHVVMKLNKAIDEVRAKEARHMTRAGYQPVLKHTRWCFLKRRENLTIDQRRTLKDVLRYDLRSVRAYMLKEAFDSFWTYRTPWWAEWFLDRWCKRAMRSRLEPIKKFAKTLRAHKALLLNWFRARSEIAMGAVEGMNTNAKLAIRKARGFRTYNVLETALYHELGHLPEPLHTHRFC
jgi:transposase